MYRVFRKHIEFDTTVLGNDIERFPPTGLSASELSKGINNGEPIYSWQVTHYAASIGAISGYLSLVETHLNTP